MSVSILCRGVIKPKCWKADRVHILTQWRLSWGAVVFPGRPYIQISKVNLSNCNSFCSIHVLLKFLGSFSRLSHHFIPLICFDIFWVYKVTQCTFSLHPGWVQTGNNTSQQCVAYHNHLYPFVAKQWPLVAVVIITAAKEEVSRSSIESAKEELDGWVKQAQDFHSGEHCSCPVWNQKTTLSSFKYLM